MNFNFFKSLIHRTLSSTTTKTKANVLENHNVKRVTPAQTDFKCTKDLFSYAREKCIAGIKSQSPHEYAVVTDTKKNKVIAEYVGDVNKCPLDDLTKLNLDKYNTLIFHGHVSGGPISPTDVKLLLDYPISQVIALDEKGKFSIIAKTGSTPTDNYQKLYNKYRQECIYETMDLPNIGAPVHSMYIDAILNKHAPLMGLRYITNLQYTLESPVRKIYH